MKTIFEKNLMELAFEEDVPACDRPECKDDSDNVECGHCKHKFKSEEKKPTCPKCHKKFRA